MQLFCVDRLLGKTPACGEIPSLRGLFLTTFHLAWPSITESFLIALVSMVDTIMVSSLGTEAIASVGLTTQPRLIGLSIFVSLNVAVSAIVARRLGQNDREDANRVLVQAMLITLALTAIVSAVCVFFADPILRFAGSAPDTHAEAAAYFRIVMGGMVFNTLSLVINAAQRGAGNTKIAMRTNLTSNLVNVFFNYLLIGGNFGFPRLGIRGAAIATVIGTVFACMMSLRSVSHPEKFLHLRFSGGLHFERKTLRSIASIGTSTLTEQLCMRFGFLVYAIIVARLGTAEFAAHQIGTNQMSLSFAIGDGLSVAGIALVGRSLGQNRPDLAKLYGSIAQRMAVCFSCLYAIFFLTLGYYVFLLFSRDEAVLAYSSFIIPFMAVITFLQISSTTLLGCLRGAGDTSYTAIISLISIGVVRPICGWVLCYPLGLGLLGAWLGLTVDQVLRLVLSMHRFRSGRWANRTV